ncbi:MAG TPA: hypothetical protein VMI73_23985 [Trebonia sp.]|nr:hypothetical protein [Trebonia sp.]
MTDGADSRDQAALIRAFLAARDGGDAALTEQAARQLPRGQRFGMHPGQLPALLHAEYQKATDPARRCGLAAALARAWVYGGHPERARAFADEALRLSSGLGDPAVAADALDAALLASWGPDALAERLRLAARLEDAAAYLADPEPRLSAHLWRLTTAWECLDVVGVQRQLRALDTLAEETGSPRVAFFAASRRAMHALVTADLAEADELIARVREAGADCGEPDLEAVTHSLDAERARRAGDLAALCAEAAAFAAYGAAEGVISISAEAAVMWLEAGEPDRALELLLQLAGGGLAAVPGDVDFLLTTASLVQVAAALRTASADRNSAAGGDPAGGALIAGIVAEGIALLEPYAGRAVLNAGAVTFHGVVDEYVFRGHAALHADAAAAWRDRAAGCYLRLGATWWRDRLGRETAGAVARPAAIAHLRRDDTGWTVGFDRATFALPDMRGLRYLSELLARPAADVAAAELAAAGAGHPGTVLTEPGDAADTLADAQALAAYRQRLRTLDDELEQARSWADEGRAARLGLEREALLAELRAVAGLGGRRRRFGSADERARVAVRKAIAAALAKIEERDPSLARLLRDTVRTGAHCRYEPDPARPVSWNLRA